MARWYSLEIPDESTFTTATELFRFPVRLPVAPERVWESLASDASVSAWGLGVRSLRWTSPRPFGVGTTREVVLPLRAMTVREEFTRWDEGKGYSFYVAAADRPGLRSFAEDYVVEPDGDGTLFTWTIALEPQRALRLPMRLGRPLNRLAFGQLVRGARNYFGQAEATSRRGR